jgi:tripartite motif-containing protein 71
MDNKKIQIAAAVLIALAVLAGIMVTMNKKKTNPKPNAPQVSEGLNRPRGMAFDAKGNLFIADSKNDRIEVQGPDGKTLRKFGKQGVANGQFREVCDVKIDKDGNVLAADTFHTSDPKGMMPWGRVQRLDAEGKFLGSFGVSGSFGPLFGPRGLAVDGEGSIYLSDTGNHRVLKFNAKGEFLFPVGSKGSKPGQFIEPFGLATDGQDNLYVADRLNYRIQVFNKQGQFQREWKAIDWEESQLCEPYLAIDAKKGLVYATASTKNNVHRWTLQGKDHKVYAKADNGAFNAPIGIVVKADGSVVVSNGGTANLVTFKP